MITTNDLKNWLTPDGHPMVSSSPVHEEGRRFLVSTPEGDKAMGCRPYAIGGTFYSVEVCDGEVVSVWIEQLNKKPALVTKDVQTIGEMESWIRMSVTLFQEVDRDC